MNNDNDNKFNKKYNYNFMEKITETDIEKINKVDDFLFYKQIHYAIKMYGVYLLLYPYEKIDLLYLIGQIEKIYKPFWQIYVYNKNNCTIIHCKWEKYLNKKYKFPFDDFYFKTNKTKKEIREYQMQKREEQWRGLKRVLKLKNDKNLKKNGNYEYFDDNFFEMVELEIKKMEEVLKK